MKVLSLIPGTSHVELIDAEEPQILHPDEVKLKVLEVGICGTDRELAAAGRAIAPLGEDHLILGHEMLGEVVEIGSAVTRFKLKDHAVVVVRRSCGGCKACLNNRADMCYGEGYLERGIKGKHGFQAEYVVDKEQFLVNVPTSILPYGVLCEPMSVVEKALDEILKIQRVRLPDWTAAEDLAEKKVLVVGLGTIGLLAAIAIRLLGFKVYGIDIVPPTSKRVQLLEEIGGTYINGLSTPYPEIPKVDLLIEAAGIAKLDFELFQVLGTNGGYVITGLPDPKAVFPISGGHLIHELVLKNQVILGSVNAGEKHWRHAIDDLCLAQKKWPGVISKLITNRLPKERFRELLGKVSEEEIKCVLVWS